MAINKNRSIKPTYDINEKITDLLYTKGYNADFPTVYSDAISAISQVFLDNPAAMPPPFTSNEYWTNDFSHYKGEIKYGFQFKGEQERTLDLTHLEIIHDKAYMFLPVDHLHHLPHARDLKTIVFEKSIQLDKEFPFSDQYIQNEYLTDALSELYRKGYLSPVKDDPTDLTIKILDQVLEKRPLGHITVPVIPSYNDATELTLHFFLSSKNITLTDITAMKNGASFTVIKSNDEIPDAKLFHQRVNAHQSLFPPKELYDLLEKKESTGLTVPGTGIKKH